MILSFKSNEDTPDYESVIMSRGLGKLIPEQNDQCFGCDKGILIDAVCWENQKKATKRKLYCMEGNTDPNLCSYRPLKLLENANKKEID